MLITKQRKQLFAVGTLLLAIALTIPALLNSQTVVQSAGSHNIIMQDLACHPQNLTVAKHDTVTWTNNDPVIYTLWFVYEENKSTYTLTNPILPGQSWSHTFSNPTKLTYYCQERLWITGRLRIVKVLGDINWDNLVDIHDLHELGKSYQSTSGQPNWNEDADIDFNNIVDQPDLSTLSNNYGKTDP
jgi:plastocyanin